VTREELAEAEHAQLIDLVLAAQVHAECERGQRLELEQQLRWFKNQLFGTKSERRFVDGDGTQQLCLGEVIAVHEEPLAPKATVRSHERRHRQPREVPDEKGLRFDDSVPMETIEVPNPDLADVPEADRELVSEKVNYRIGQRPGSYFVVKIIRKTVKRKDTGELTTAPAPLAVLEKSYADVSLLAGMLVDKFRYHLPLYRQHQRMQASGITVSRASLTSWVGQAAWLLEPIYDAQLASILKSQVLAMDETPIRAGRKAKGKMRTGYFWPVYGDQDEVAFPYASSRSKRVIAETLGEFSGTLLSDGYDAYDRFASRRDEVTHALCWAHARRYFVKAEDLEPVRAAHALGLIRRLYEHEDAIRKKDLEGGDKLQVRAEKSKPVVEAFFAWLEGELAQAALLPTNPFTKAALYALHRKKGLEVFLANPDVPIDTNHLERTLRVIPMGRKNWLFCWTELGAHHVGQVQSLLTTCVLHGVDPHTYLVDILQRIAIHPQDQVAELTPRLWKDRFADAPLRSWVG
jgi:transposase